MTVSEQVEYDLSPAESTPTDLEDRRDELAEVTIESPLEVFKRHMVQLFPELDPEVVKNLKVREGLELDPNEIPTRREELGYAWVPTTEDRRKHKSVPRWARDVRCPRCGTVMEVITSKYQTKFGENVTYQCHRIDDKQRMCLTVVQVTTGTYYMMRPGDFTKSDWNWSRVAAQTNIPMVEGVSLKGAEPEEEFKLPERMPPHQWTKGRTLTRVVWEEFWRLAFEDDGAVSADQLMRAVQEIRPQDKEGNFYHKLERKILEIPDWMLLYTGFVIKNFNGTLKVLGRSRGDLREYPFSDENYRKEFGFGS